MDFDGFIKNVMDATGERSRERAELATRATLNSLVRRIGTGEGTDLAAQLPEGLKEDVAAAAGETESFSLEGFFARVQDEGGMADRTEAERYARAVVGVLNEAVTAGEIGDVSSQLPGEFQDLFAPRDV